MDTKLISQPARKSTQILINSVENELKVQWAGTMFKLEVYRVRPRWGSLLASQGDKVEQHECGLAERVKWENSGERKIQS